MRLTSILGSLALALVVNAAPALEGKPPTTTPGPKTSSVAPRVATNSLTRDVTSDHTTQTTQTTQTTPLRKEKKPSSTSSKKSDVTPSQFSSEEKAKVICYSNTADVEGPGSGKSKDDVWKESKMDDFLPILDQFLPGNKAPFNAYSASLPEMISGLINEFEDWHCTVNDCPELNMPNYKTCMASGKGARNAQWYELAQGLRNYRTFIKALQENIQQVGEDTKDAVRDILDMIKKIKLDTSNAGWSILIATILAAVSAATFRLPGLAASLAGASAIFGIPTTTMAFIGNKNDAEIIKHFTDNDNTVAGISKTFKHTSDQLNGFLEKVLEETPKNSKDKHYSSYDYSAVNLLKGGTFADTASHNITKEISDGVQRSVISGVLKNHWQHLVIGSRSKKIFGKKPCDLKPAKKHKGYAAEFKKVCINETAYFIGKPSQIQDPTKKWDAVESWGDFADSKNKDRFRGLTPDDVVKSSLASAKKYGWVKEWKVDKDMVDMAVENAKSGDEVLMFNYPVLNLDNVDDSPGKKFITHNYHSSAGNGVKPWTQEWLFRGYFMQASACQKDPKGKPYPTATKWKMVTDGVGSHIDYNKKKCH